MEESERQFLNMFREAIEADNKILEAKIVGIDLSKFTKEEILKLDKKDFIHCALFTIPQQ